MVRMSPLVQRILTIAQGSHVLLGPMYSYIYWAKIIHTHIHREIYQSKIDFFFPESKNSESAFMPSFSVTRTGTNEAHGAQN